MLPLLSPLDAYRSDLSRHPGRKDFGRSDTVWLLVAHCLHRLTRAGHTSRSLISEYCAAALKDLTENADPSCDEDRQLQQDLLRLRDGLARSAERDGLEMISGGARSMAREMAETGALALSYSTLGHLRLAFSSMPPVELALNVVEQARTARLLGDLDGADELLEMSVEIGTRADSAEVIARAMINKGVIARVRGNYPRSRTCFRTALDRAIPAGLVELQAMAHQGLVIAAGVAGDMDTALQHGWAAFRLAAGNSAREAEMLHNLAHLCLLAGYPAASLRGFVSAARRCDTPRFRLPTYGSAAEAAAQLDQGPVVERLATAIDELVAASALPYESAQSLRSLSVAFSALGEAERAESYRMRARDLARKNGFLELVYKTEKPDIAIVASASVPPRGLSKTSHEVVASITALDEVEANDHELQLVSQPG
jgi:tetratricopeptide (TPR) repeat protein